MIVYPERWKLNYDAFAKSLGSEKFNKIEFINILEKILSKFDVKHLAYSGGIDSTLMLVMMKKVYGQINTYTISSRENHPDIHFSRLGVEKYGTNHLEFIVAPNHSEIDVFPGDNAVRQLFENVSNYTNKIICCDGIDEFMCGYYDHMKLDFNIYEYYLSRLLPDHLIPLNQISQHVNVFLPYLDKKIVDKLSNVYYYYKVDKENRKKLMSSTAEYLGIPKEIIYRNKYGFCDAFIERNK
jgi:asparagine synthetase B (glutamine-hydrolysing)